VGAHIHHGYWISGEETKETAQNQLVEHVARAAGLGPGCKILDVGCGFGGSSIYLAKKYGAEATGITISPIQVEMARKAAAAEGVKAKFILMDAEEMKFEQTFHVVWSVESISHYPQKERFFAAAAQCLESGGTLALTDWFKRKHLTEREYEKFIQPIEKGMLVEMDTMEEYEGLLRSNGFQVVHNEILNKNCSKSWTSGWIFLRIKRSGKSRRNTARRLSTFSGPSAPCERDTLPEISSTDLSWPRKFKPRAYN